MRQTNNDPTSGSAVWSPWTQFIGSEYEGRGFQFRALLAAPAGQNVAVEELCIIADVSAKMAYDSDVAWTGAKMHITYPFTFVYMPSIAIAVQQGVVGDTFRITAKTRSGFDIELINSAGAVITAARTFEWIAQGY